MVYHSKVVNANVITVSSIFNHSAESLFQKVLEKENMIELARPFAAIRFYENAAGHEKFWEAGNRYELEIKPFGIANVWGTHYMRMLNIDQSRLKMEIRARNNRCKIWDHTVTLKKISDTQTEYTDEIILYAGGLTNFIARIVARTFASGHRRLSNLVKS
jgi:hypothetical protein